MTFTVKFTGKSKSRDIVAKVTFVVIYFKNRHLTSLQFPTFWQKNANLKKNQKISFKIEFDLIFSIFMFN